MYTIIICDDDFDFAQKLSAMVQAYMDQKGLVISLSLYASGHDALQFTGLYADLYFIDEQMPFMSGMELASLIRESNSTAAIIFVSHVHGAVFQSLRYSPLRFIRKDCLQDELEEALDAFCTRFQAVDQNISLVISNSNTQKNILLRDILYIESKAHYLIFHCQNTTYKVRSKLSDYEHKVSSHQFSRTSQSFIVNLKHVTNVLQGKIILANCIEVPVSRKFKPSFEHDYLKYQRLLTSKL